MNGQSIVLFDGVCNLCNSAVLFIIDRDPHGRFAFAPLQSDFAADLLARHGGTATAPNGDSIVLIEEGAMFQRSDAVLRIAGRLSGPWPLLRAFRIVPAALRNWLYDRLARNRYRWFGREDVCRVPTPELKSRFLA